MISLKSMVISGLAALVSIASVFFYGVRKGRKSKESEIIKEGYKDAMATKIREDDRRNDNIDDVVKRMRKYSGK